jgi:hypothetical protein
MVTQYLHLALKLTATTYGYNEKMCGDPHSPQVCDSKAVTATGEKFNPEELTVALPLPKNRILRKGVTVSLWSYHKQECIVVKVTDKKNERYIGNSGLDVTPGVLKALYGKANKSWSGKLTQCEVG